MVKWQQTKFKKKDNTQREKIQKAQLKAEKIGTKRGPHKALTDQRERGKTNSW